MSVVPISNKNEDRNKQTIGYNNAKVIYDLCKTVGQKPDYGRFSSEWGKKIWTEDR